MNIQRIEDFVCRLGYDKTKKDVEIHLKNRGADCLIQNAHIAIDDLKNDRFIYGDMIILLGCILSQMKDVPIMYFFD